MWIMASLLGAMALAAKVLATEPAPAIAMGTLLASAPLTEGEGAWRSERDELGDDHAESGSGAGSSLLRIWRKSIMLDWRDEMSEG
jgi:hypothetical protein